MHTEIGALLVVSVFISILFLYLCFKSSHYILRSASIFFPHIIRSVSQGSSTFPAGFMEQMLLLSFIRAVVLPPHTLPRCSNVHLSYQERYGGLMSHSVWWAKQAFLSLIKISFRGYHQL